MRTNPPRTRSGSRHLLPWDLAAKYPDKLKEMVQLFDSEARRNNVYPLTPSRSLPPAPYGAATSFLYHAGVDRIPAASAPRLTGRAHRITADMQIPEGNAEAVILAGKAHIVLEFTPDTVANRRPGTRIAILGVNNFEGELL